MAGTWDAIKGSMGQGISRCNGSAFGQMGNAVGKFGSKLNRIVAGLPDHFPL